MKLYQLETLTEDEVAMALYIVNFIDPPCCPKIEFSVRDLTWFKHDMLVQKLVNAFPKLLPDAHPIFLSLMEKLGVKGEIKNEQKNENIPISGSNSRVCEDPSGIPPITGSQTP